MQASRLKTFLLLLFALLSSLNLSAQVLSPAEKLQKDYPLLTARYGNQLEGEKAHYIFVVDVSSSMLPYEKVEKDNLLKFVDAVPDGDQITIIRMADENYTDYVNMFKCITLNRDVRASIRQNVNSPAFLFLKNSDNRNGSDGFRTASLIVDAINTVGSNELTFIYLFTDFEYWTHTHHFDKTKEDWKSLEGKVPATYMSGMCKFGIELSTGAQLHQEGVFKPEMDAIFGDIKYLPVTSASVLSQWFGHIISDVMATKLYSSLKKEWKELTDAPEISSKMSGDQVKVSLGLTQPKESPLVTSADLSIKANLSELQPQTAEQTEPGKEGVVGQFAVERGLLPGYVTLNGEEANLEVTYHSDYEDEIQRLRLVCLENDNDPDAVTLTKNYSLNELKCSVWKSFIPLWVWILIGIILLILLASVLYTLFVLKTNHTWVVKVKENGVTLKCPVPGFQAPFSVGKGGDFKVPDVSWMLSIKAQRHNPLLFWKKSGYYILWTGSPLSVKNEYKEEVAVCEPNEETRLCTLKSGGIFIIEKDSHKVELAI